MCGRYTYLFTWKQLQRLMRLHEHPSAELSPRYNVAPTQFAPIVYVNAAMQRIASLAQWGLLASWVNEPAAVVHPINARGETIFSSPMFRKPAASQRCLIPVSGFYEWQKPPDTHARKQPFWIGRSDRQPLFFAGLWDIWHDRAADNSPPLQTFTIITTTPNALMAPIHDRMPVILSDSDHAAWLDPATDIHLVQGMIQPYLNSDLVAYPVSTRVNSPKTDHPSLIEPDIPPKNLPGLFE